MRVGVWKRAVDGHVVAAGSRIRLGVCSVVSLRSVVSTQAFVRFASVYRNFRDLDEFKHELNDKNMLKGWI